MAKLSFIDPSGQVLYVPVESSFTIGRSDQASFVYNQAGISRLHVQISKYGSSWFLVDQGSTNGTFLNNYQLPAGEFFAIRNGDELRLAQAALKVELDGSEESTDPSLSVFGSDSYQGEFFIGVSTSFSLGGATATIPSGQLGTDELIFIVRREGGSLIVSQKSREYIVSVNGNKIEGRVELQDRDKIQIGSYLFYVNIPSPVVSNVDQEEEVVDDEAEVPSYLKERMGSDSWDDPLQRRKSTGTLLSVDKFISEEIGKMSYSSPELGVHRFSSAKLKIEEDSLKKSSQEFFMGVLSIVLTIFMGGVLLYIY